MMELAIYIWSRFLRVSLWLVHNGTLWNIMECHVCISALAYAVGCSSTKKWQSKGSLGERKSVSFNPCMLL
jgi:hypothetical protein